MEQTHQGSVLLCVVAFQWTSLRTELHSQKQSGPQSTPAGSSPPVPDKQTRICVWIHATHESHSRDVWIKIFIFTSLTSSPWHPHFICLEALRELNSTHYLWWITTQHVEGHGSICLSDWDVSPDHPVALLPGEGLHWVNTTLPFQSFGRTNSSSSSDVSS